MGFRKNVSIVIGLLLTVIACSGGERMDQIKLHPILKNLSSKPQVFSIDPLKMNTVTGKRGTRLIIPERAFTINYVALKKGEEVQVKLTEYVDNLDFATSGVGLIYKDQKGDDVLFESAGMFRVGASIRGTSIKLRNNKKITVLFPNTTPGKQFNVYKLNQAGQWQYDGHNQERDPSFSDKKDGPPLTKKQLKKIRRRVKVNRRIVGVRKYLISELTLWNFDVPRRDLVCIQVRVNSGKVGSIQIFVIGVSKKGFDHRYVPLKDGVFQTHFIPNATFRILAFGNDEKIGKSGLIRTGWLRKPGTENNCQDIGLIKMVKVPERLIKSRKAFNKFMGLGTEKYKVKYP